MSTKEVKLEEVEVLKVQLAVSQINGLQSQLALIEEKQKALLKELGVKYGGEIQNLNPTTGMAVIAIPGSAEQPDNSQPS